jgi:hypothetical protein
MANDSRRSKALAILAITGILRSNYEPPCLRLLWRVGIDAPPPHFMPFLQTALVAGVWFGCAFGAFMWGLVWARQGMPAALAASLAGGVGVFFGVAMGAYYAHGRRRHRLPDWRSL